MRAPSTTKNGARYMNNVARERRRVEESLKDQNEFGCEENAGKQTKRQCAVMLEQRNATNRHHAEINSAATVERTAACVSGGISWIASLVAT